MNETSGTFEPVSRPTALRDQIHDRLRAAILRGDLAPGTPVIESELALSLGASRTPVREALRRLETEGLLEPRGGRGTVVRTVDPGEVRCIYEIREALESLAARRAAQAIEDDGLARLSAHLAAMRAAIDDPEELERADTAFHDEVVRIGGGRRLTKMLTEIREETIRYRFLSLGDRNRRQATVEEHGTILDALRERDPDRAATAAMIHLQHAREAVR